MARIAKGGSRWDQASRGYRRKHPMCATCEKEGRFTLATCVDHIVPHKGDRALFWDRNNWQSLCERCHNKVKQKLERNAHKGVDIDGYPTDPHHLANR